MVIYNELKRFMEEAAVACLMTLSQYLSRTEDTYTCDPGS